MASKGLTWELLIVIIILQTFCTYNDFFGFLSSTLCIHCFVHIKKKENVHASSSHFAFTHMVQGSFNVSCVTVFFCFMLVSPAIFADSSSFLTAGNCLKRCLIDLKRLMVGLKRCLVRLQVYP